MAIVMSDNFDGTPGAPFFGDSKFTVGAGAPVLVAAHYGVGVRLPAGAPAYLSQAAFPGTTGPRVFSRIYRLSAIPAATSQIFQVRATGALCTASIRSDGRLALHNAGSTATILAATTGAVPIGTEFRVVFTVNGTSFTAAIYPNISATTPTQGLTATITGGTMTTTTEGSPSAGGIGGDFDIIWPVDDDATDPGLRRYVYLTADKVTGVVPKTVAVTVHDENIPPGTKTYSVDFGDGVTVGPQADPAFEHTFTTAGIFPMIPKVDLE